MSSCSHLPDHQQIRFLLNEVSDSRCTQIQVQCPGMQTIFFCDGGPDNRYFLEFNSEIAQESFKICKALAVMLNLACFLEE